VKPLHQLPRSDLHALIDDGSVRALLTAQEQEAYLTELERQPPVWDQLHDPPGEEHGARLFALNRRRDGLREGHPLLNQRIAFLWGAVLGSFLPDRHGFKLSIGPEPTQTTWGLVRFKPVGLPHEMIARPSPAVLAALRQRTAAGEKIPVGILFTGKLIPWESIIYGFSHDGLEEGMVMPVVEVDSVEYFITPEPQR